MKNWLLFFVFGLSVNIHASMELVREAFLKHETVAAALARATSLHQRVDQEPHVILLSRSCNYRGCLESYLANIGIHYDPGFNPSSWSITAKVALSYDKITNIELIDL